MKLNKIYFGDCLDLIPLNVEDKSIDLILCDLPYGTTNCRWDSVIDLEKLWIQYKRVIKDNGAIVLFAQTPFDKALGASNLKMLRYEWIWEKTQATGHLNAKKMPMKAHENILVFYKKLPKYNPQKTNGHPPVNKYTKYLETQNNTEIYGAVSKELSGGGNTDRYPRSVLTYPSDKQRIKLHSTQKPLDLIKEMILTYTDEGDIVMDNACGSGTTGIGCIELGRNYIMMENDREIHQTAIDRVLATNKPNTNK